jgi:hypothetical protein
VLTLLLLQLLLLLLLLENISSFAVADVASGDASPAPAQTTRSSSPRIKAIES